MSYKEYLDERVQMDEDINEFVQKLQKSLGKLPFVKNIIPMLKGTAEDIVKRLVPKIGNVSEEEFEKARKIASIIRKGERVEESVLYVEGLLSGMRDIKKIVMIAMLALTISGIANSAMAQAGEDATVKDFNSSIEHVLEGDDDVSDDTEVIDILMNGKEKQKDIIKQFEKDDNAVKKGWANINVEDGKASIGKGVDSDKDTAIEKAELNAKNAFIRHGHGDGENISKTVSGLSAQAFHGHIEERRGVYTAYAQAWK